MSAAISAARRDNDQPSVVIMPFDNLSGTGDEYFVDGVVVEITSTLSRVREFFVIARQSAFAYKGRFVDVRDVGRELGVTYVVEGTVRRGGDRLRISVQLVDAETRSQLWSDRYEGATKDIFEFQDRIAAQVAGAIHPAIRSAEIELSTRKPPNSLRAYDQVLRAYPKLWGHNAEDNKEAISILRQAIALDERYGRAHALLAWCHAQEVVYIWSSDVEHDRACALKAVKAASVSIDDDPTALTAAGAALSLLFDQVRAAAYIERALALDPNNAWAWARYGWVANYCDEPARARERFERALTLSPFDPLAFNSRLGIAQALAMGGDWAGAARLAREVIDQNPRVTWAYRILAYSSAIAGNSKTAQRAVRELLAGQPNASIEQFKSVAPTSQVPRFFRQALEGLRQAGLPEK